MRKIIILLCLIISIQVHAETYKCGIDKPCPINVSFECVIDGKEVIQSTYCPPDNIQEDKDANNYDNTASYNSNYSSSMPDRGCQNGTRRDTNGRIKRSATAKNEFKRQSPCPANGNRSGSCPGYVIDHITPLANGGEDSPSNMQWQTVAEAKKKDSWERDGCKDHKDHHASSRRHYHIDPFFYPSGGSSYGYSGYSGNSTIYTGPRGGHYTITSGGNKSYIRH